MSDKRWPISRPDDPDLLLWVHGVGVDYSLRAYQAYAYRLSPADADCFVDEMRISGSLVGLEKELAPKSVDELRSYLDG